MSTWKDIGAALREVLRLTDDVKAAGERLKDISRELRDHDRRITRLEAKWETAVELSRIAPQPPALPKG